MSAPVKAELLRLAAYLVEAFEAVDAKAYIVVDYNQIYISDKPEGEGGEKIAIWEN